MREFSKSFLFGRSTVSQGTQRFFSNDRKLPFFITNNGLGSSADLERLLSDIAERQQLREQQKQEQQLVAQLTKLEELEDGEYTGMNAMTLYDEMVFAAKTVKAVREKREKEGTNDSVNPISSLRKKN